MAKSMDLKGQKEGHEPNTFSSLKGWLHSLSRKFFSISFSVQFITFFHFYELLLIMTSLLAVTLCDFLDLYVINYSQLSFL